VAVAEAAEQEPLVAQVGPEAAEQAEVTVTEQMQRLILAEAEAVLENRALHL
jgi:hypothetical protein